MPELLLATNNKGKVAELRRLFNGCGWSLTTPTETGLALDPEETGASYAENARLKAEAFAVASGHWSLADDSGLEVDALDGAPGLHSARFGGADLPHTEKMALVLEKIRQAPPEGRTARFRAAFALAAPDGRVWESEGVCEGHIADAPRGEGGFGYDPVFLPLESPGRSMAELEDAEKDAISHRGEAARRLVPVLRALAEVAG